MRLEMKGINTGVIHHNNRFIALALKVRQPRNKETMLYFPLIVLKDLLIALEHRIHQQQQLTGEARAAFEKARNSATKKMHKAIPAIQEDDLQRADIQFRVNSLSLLDNSDAGMEFALALNSGNTVNLVVNEYQVELLIMVIIQAINSAGMQDLGLRLSSLLDFLPLYDADCQNNGKMEYDTYDQPVWKRKLFQHYLAIIYQYHDEAGKVCHCGTVIKTRSQANTPETEAISHRLIRFSPRLSKIQDKSCKVFAKTMVSGSHEVLTQDQCMRALDEMRQNIQKAS